MRSIVALDSDASELDVLACIQIHIELDLSLQSVELLFTLFDAADNHDGGDND